MSVEVNLNKYQKVNLLSLVDIETAKKNKIYKKGCIIIQIHATRGQIYYLNEDKTVESKYAVLIPKNVCGHYLYYILEKELPHFLKKHQTTLNIQPEIFKYLELVIHDDIQTQEYIAEILSHIDNLIGAEQKLLEEFKDLKDYHVDKMFA